MGARKFVVAVVGQLGCSPSEFCDEIKNGKVKPMSDKLPRKLQELQSQLSGSLFISSNPFNFFNEIRKAPEKFGEWHLCSKYKKNVTCDLSLTGISYIYQFNDFFVVVY